MGFKDYWKGEEIKILLFIELKTLKNKIEWAKRYLKTMFDKFIWIGQMRVFLDGLNGWVRI